MDDNIFYSHVSPRFFSDKKHLLYYNEDVANLIDLNININDISSHCIDILLEYLSFEREIPGSKPISIPHSEYRYISKNKDGSYSATLLPESNGDGILIGTIKNKNGITYDLFAKGISNVPYSGLSNGVLTLKDSIFELITETAIDALNIKSVLNLALIGSDAMFTEKKGRDSSVILLQIAPTFIRPGTIEYFVNQHKMHEANEIISFIHKHFYPNTILSNNFKDFCNTDDDDDEEDDDEYCYRSGTEDILGEINTSIYSNILPLGYLPYQASIISSGTFGIDGTILNTRNSRFKEFGNVDIITCGSKDEKSGNILTSDKFRIFRTSVLQSLGLKLGLPIQRANEIVSNVRINTNEIESSILNRKIGLSIDAIDIFFEFKEIEINPRLAGNIDWLLFFRYFSNITKTQSTKHQEETPLDESFWGAVYSPNKNIIQTLQKKIKNYRKVLENEEYLDYEDRKKYIESFHPAFLPRTNLISKSIKEIEKNNILFFNELVKYTKEPFNTNIPNSEWNTVSTITIFPCSPTDKVSDGDIIKRVQLLR